MTAEPKSVPSTDPRPPFRLVPPITQAAIGVQLHQLADADRGGPGIGGLEEPGQGHQQAHEGVRPP